MHPKVETWYKDMQKRRKELPDWPLTVFGPVASIKELDSFGLKLMDGETHDPVWMTTCP